MPLNEGAYSIKWLLAITDKGDNRYCRFNRIKGEPLYNLRLGIPGS